MRTYGSAAELFYASDLNACDCYVIDQRMPVMSGMELIAKLRDRGVATPAILLTSQPNASLSPERQWLIFLSWKSHCSAMLWLKGFREACGPANG